MSEGFFPGEAKDFSREAKNGEISFSQFKSKKTSFAKNLIGKRQISKSREGRGTYRHGRNYVGDTVEVLAKRVHEFKCLSK